MQYLFVRLYNAIYRCHNRTVVTFFKNFCKHKQITLREVPISKWFANSKLPPLVDIGDALLESKPLPPPYVPPVPENLNEILNNTYLLNGWIPNAERLLLMFPNYLALYFMLQDTLLEQSSLLDQPLCYFLAICAASHLGSLYSINRFTKRFLEIGGNIDWLHGKIPAKVSNILWLSHTLAFCPYEVKKQHILQLTSGPDAWSIPEIVQAAAIMTFSHMASGIALANGLNCQEEIKLPLDLSALSKHPNWQKTEPIRNDSPPEKFHKHHSQEPITETMIIKKSSSLTRDMIPDSHLKDINEQLKNNTIYDQIYEAFKHFWPQYKKVTRRNEQVHAALHHYEYNFKYNAYPFLKDIHNDMAEKLLSLLDYSKDMTCGKIGDQFVNTSAFRKATRHYGQNIVGYIYSDYDYKKHVRCQKTQMTDFLSKELKFLIKLLTLQPFLIRSEILRNIIHQGAELSMIDIAHVTLLVLTTKMEYSMMMLCRVLQNLGG